MALPLLKDCALCAQEFWAEFARAKPNLPWITSDLCFACEFKLRTDAENDARS